MMCSTNKDYLAAINSDSPESPTAVTQYGKAEVPFPTSEMGDRLSLNIFYQYQRGWRCMSNCRSIAVILLLPLYASDSPSVLSVDQSVKREKGGGGDSFGDPELGVETAGQALENTKMPTDQVPDPDASLTINSIMSHDNLTISSPPLSGGAGGAEGFRFLDLPLELRLKIYGYLLPPRTHTIVTQIPHNGFFYNTSSIPARSATTFYPFSRSPPSSGQVKYTTYKVLTTNFRKNFPDPSIHTELLLVNKQILAEAEPVLYGHKDAKWDFGVHLDALVAFWSDRSETARRLVKNIRIAKQIPPLVSLPAEGEKQQPADPLWDGICTFITSEMSGLRLLDLTMWSSSGSPASFPTSIKPINTTLDISPEDQSLALAEQRQKWQEWDYTHELLSMPTLRKAKVTWWGLQKSNDDTPDGREGDWLGFGTWIAGRMVGDKLVRDRMVRDGVVVEGVVIVPGKGV